jgi:phage tail sheath protein FI
LKPIPNSAGTGSNLVFGLDSQVGLAAEVVSGSTAAAEISKRNFCLALQGGYNGINPIIPIKKGADITNTNTQGFDCDSLTTWGGKAYVKALNTISNADEIDINLLVTPGLIREFHDELVDRAIDVCEAREDVFYIADFVGADSSISTAVEQAGLRDSNYVGTYYPWVKTVDSLTNRLLPVPPSVLMVGTYAQNDRLGAEWFAPAGLNRGGIQGAVQVMNRLTQSERDTLYEGKVNPIAAFPGQGISAFGQKTLQESSSALDRINVRRLLINLKKFVASTSRFLVFEQNTGQTRAKFLNTVNPYLESVQQRQGLFAFRVVMDETNNTPDVIDRNILQGSVFLQPAKTAEFIVIDFNILPTGATFSV